MIGSIFTPHIEIPATPGAPIADDSKLTSEQRQFADALRVRYGDHVEAMATADVDRLLTFYTDDVVWMGDGWPSRHGKGEMRSLFNDVAGTSRVRFRSLCAAVEGGMGWNFVDYSVTPVDPDVAPWTFRTTFQWVREAGEWRCNGVLCYAV
jgi:ketosteroid isomerase-like protein